MHALIHFADPLPEATTDHPRPERRVAGNPLRTTWLRYQSADGLTAAGVWHCEPGRWRIAFGAGEEEYFHVTAGRCRVHDAAGGFREYGAGEACIIPPGFEGEFEVIEALTKHFVTVDRAAFDEDDLPE